MLTNIEIEKVEKIATLFQSNLVKVPKEQRNLRLALYECLALGEPVSKNDLAAYLCISLKSVEKQLKAMSGISYESGGRISEFSGLSTIRQTAHKLIIDGKTVYNWCALDTLMFGTLIHKSARIESRCPVTDKVIELRISPEKIESSHPKTAVMSLVTNSSDSITDENIRTSFCCHVNFFSNSEVGEKWALHRSPNFIFLSLEESFLLGKNLGMKMFPNALARTKIQETI